MNPKLSRRSLLASIGAAATAPVLGLPLSASPGAAAISPFVAGAHSNENFSIIVLPDTQRSMQKWPTNFNAQIDWIKANRNTVWNIRYVAHVGDVVHNYDDPVQWQRARAGMSKLDGIVPYTIAAGNHDVTGDPATRNFTHFNTYFPYSKFDVLQGAGSTFAANRYEHHWHRFSAGGTDWAILSLGWAPSDAEIAWAARTVAAHPQRQFIINVHDFMLASTGGLTENGHVLWSALVKAYPNIVMVTYYDLQACQRGC